MKKQAMSGMAWHGAWYGFPGRGLACPPLVGLLCYVACLFKVLVSKFLPLLRLVNAMEPANRTYRQRDVARDSQKVLSR